MSKINRLITVLFLTVIILCDWCHCIAALRPTDINTECEIDSVTIYENACESYYWENTDLNYIASGVYSDTLANSFNCDSIVYLDLTINNHTEVETRESITSCGSFTWPISNRTFDESGSYSAVLQNVQGCDSVIWLDLTINRGVREILKETHLNRYEWPVNNQVYELSGIYTHTATASNGCDSTLILNLTINRSANNEPTVSTQTPGLAWVQSTLSSGTETLGEVISHDLHGNVFVGGTFQETVDFDPSENISELEEVGNSTFFIKKFDGRGNFLWANSIPVNAWNDNIDLITDSNGDLIVVGNYSGDESESLMTITGEEIVFESNYSHRIFILKYNAAGDLIWGQILGNNFSEVSNVSLTHNGNEELLVAGRFSGEIDIDSSEEIELISGEGIFILKLTGAGSLVSAFTIEGSSLTSTDIEVGPSENIFLVGSFSGTEDFDNSEENDFLLTSSGDRDVFILKSSKEGSLIWAKSFGGVETDYPTCIKVNENGNPVISGDFEKSVDFDPNESEHIIEASSYFDGFILQLDESGNFDWVNTIGHLNRDYMNALDVDQFGNIYSVGKMASNNIIIETYYGPQNLSLSGDSRLFVQKISNRGEVIWFQLFGNDDYGNITSVQVDELGNIYATGFFRKIVDFDLTENEVILESKDYDEDVFTLKLAPGQATNLVYDSITTQCVNYTWPVNNTTYIEPGSYHELYSSQEGTDSIRVLDLYFDPIETKEFGFLSLTDSFLGINDLEGNHIKSEVIRDSSELIEALGDTMNIDIEGYSDGIIIKRDPSGKVIWYNLLTGSGTIRSLKTTVDRSGNIIALGTFGGLNYLHPQQASLGRIESVNNADIFVAKYSKNGELIWSHIVYQENIINGNTQRYIYPEFLEADHFGNIYFSGEFDRTISFNCNDEVCEYVGAMDDSSYIFKLNSRGKIIWSTDFGATIVDNSVHSRDGVKIKSLRLDRQGNLYLGGSFSGYAYVDFDPTDGINLVRPFNSAYDGFIQKIDSIGNSVWLNIYGGRRSDHVVDLDISDGGDVFAIGVFQDEVDFDLTENEQLLEATSISSPTTAPSDPFVISLNEQGDLTWVKSFNSGRMSLHTISVDQENYSYITGRFQGYTDLDPGACDNTLYGGSENDFGTTFVESLNPEGEFQWLETIGNPTKVFIRSFRRDIFNSIIFQGDYKQTLTVPTTNGNATLDTNEFSAPFELTLGVCQDSESIEQHITTCTEYTWPISGETYTSDGQYFYSGVNALGCSFESTLILEILQPTYLEVDAESCNSYNWNQTTYYESGRYINSFTNRLGCDSIVSLNLTIHRDSVYSVENVVSTCSYYYWPVNESTYIDEGSYEETFLSNHGCDSTHVLNLSFDLEIFEESRTICGGSEFLFNDQFLRESGEYMEVFKDTNQCDSTVHLILTVNSSETSLALINDTLFTVQNADQYTWIDCETGDVILGQDTFQFALEKNGYYAVEVMKDGCTLHSDCIEYVDDIDEIELTIAEELELTVYPNPGTGTFHVILNESFLPGRYKVHDILGHILDQGFINETKEFTLDLEAPQGVYFLSFFDNSGQEWKTKIVVSDF